MRHGAERETPRALKKQADDHERRSSVVYAAESIEKVRRAHNAQRERAEHHAVPHGAVTVLREPLRREPYTPRIAIFDAQVEG